MINVNECGGVCAPACVDASRPFHNLKRQTYYLKTKSIKKKKTKAKQEKKPTALFYCRFLWTSPLLRDCKRSLPAADCRWWCRCCFRRANTKLKAGCLIKCARWSQERGADTTSAPSFICKPPKRGLKYRKWECTPCIYPLIGNTNDQMREGCERMGTRCQQSSERQERRRREGIRLWCERASEN